ncbi:hypothetical protein BDZ90DRAFT_87740 [Jaminaea rosea]|uniref:Uncharacterized protein n=1 Tax=Jaminaea rosea TaxID=1569628 RepID=A0A316ULS0_9BASI|nr:hypothetical protein BDZ90DRAFT_87740 [Jaminaea rosea]PWN24873.1 hypothetical protein BDZ90DRAFT_87740 [Jaminaea rosea]
MSVDLICSSSTTWLHTRKLPRIVMPSVVLSIISIAIIYSVSLSSSPAQAARIKLGNCYKQKNCDPTHLEPYYIVFGDTDVPDLPLQVNYSGCLSFLAGAQPYTRMNVCRESSCTQACDAADVEGECVSLPENAVEGSMYKCLRQVKERMETC